MILKQRVAIIVITATATATVTVTATGNMGSDVKKAGGSFGSAKLCTTQFYIS